MIPLDTDVWMFIAHHDGDRRAATFTVCHNQGQVTSAVRHELFGYNPTTPEEEEEIRQAVEALVEDGRIQFEGDAPLQLLRTTVPLLGSDERVELLASACEIAKREGRDTNWSGFLASATACLAQHNRRPVTARTYRIVGDPG